MVLAKGCKFLAVVALLILAGFVLPAIGRAGALEDALDNPVGPDGVTPLVFTTDGGALWAADMATTYSGSASAKSGTVGGSMFSSLTTTVSGPASVSFYQKVSSEPTYDGLSFYIDNLTTPKYKTTGEVNWQQKAFTLPAGSHTLLWKYSKNATISRGSDAAWLDKVVVSPHTALAVTSPNGGEKLNAGATATITWNAPAAAEKYDLYYTTNNGMTWQLITSGYASPAFTNITYSSWTLPVPKGNSTACKVKVVAKNAAGRVVGSDVSDKPFTIQVLKVTSPNGGELLGAQTTPTIAFTVYGQQNAASAAISYTMDNGASWHAITTLTGALPPGSYSYSSWRVPAVTTPKTACKVKVVLKSATGAVLGSDMSDLTFAIQPVLALAGVVTLNGQAFPGVTMSLTGDGTGTATTDVSGKYSFMQLVNGNYTIRPSRFGYSFTPSSVTRTISGTSITGVNFTATPGDTTPPSVPTGLRVTVANPQSTTADLSWTASTDNSLVWGYKIYRNGNYLKAVAGTSTSDAGLALNAGYCYAVSAYDFVGNESARCAPMCVDRIPPTVPEILSANPVYPSQVDLSWTAATDIGTGVEGYKLYRDGVLVKSPIIETAASNGGLMQGTSYCFTVTAFDKALNESAQSSPVCPTTPAWQYEYVAKSTTTASVQSMNNGDYSAIAIDGAGHLHAVYENDNAWPYSTYQYATNASGPWAATTLSNISWEGVASSIATDTNDKVHISYHASNTSVLYYMTNSLGSWATTSIDSGNAGVNTGACNSLAVDKNNKVHVSYCDGNGAYLKYATNASGSWVTTLIDTDTYWQGVSGSSLALDSQGNVHISYVCGTFNNSDSVKYATNAAGSWVATVIDGDANADSTSIGIDSKDKIHIAYRDWSYGTLRYAANASGQWTSISIDHQPNYVADGSYPSLKIDMNDKVHIAYQEQDNYNDPHYRTLKHATNASGEWIAVYVVEPVGSLNLGYSNSLIVDQNNKLHIGTYDAVNLGLKHEFY